MKKFFLVYQPKTKTDVGNMNSWMQWYEANTNFNFTNYPFIDQAAGINNTQAAKLDVSDFKPLIRAIDIVEAESLDEVMELSKSCPLVIEDKGEIVVYEAMDMSKMQG